MASWEGTWVILADCGVRWSQVVLAEVLGSVWVLDFADVVGELARKRERISHCLITFQCSKLQPG